MPATGRLPNFLIIGAMKAGTTSLFRWLEQHPDVFTSHPKELNFFSKHWGRGVDWYRDQFPAGPQRAVGEASPGYMASPTCVARMAETVPEAKLIVLLRDPVARAYSHYCHHRLRRREHASFADAVRRPENPYVRLGRYRQHLDVVMQHFGRNTLQVVLFDDLVGDPEGTFATVCRFLGIDDDPVPDVVGQTFNPTTGIRSPDVQWRVERLETERRIPPAAAGIIRRLNRKPLDIPPIDPTAAADLRSQYADDIVALGDWLGRDLSRWLSDE